MILRILKVIYIYCRHRGDGNVWWENKATLRYNIDKMHLQYVYTQIETTIDLGFSLTKIATLSHRSTNNSILYDSTSTPTTHTLKHNVVDGFFSIFLMPNHIKICDPITS